MARTPRSTTRFAALIGGLSLLVAGLASVPAPATATPTGDDLVISEVYGGGGGGTGSPSYTHDFIELYNPTSEAVSLAGWSVQYKSNTGDNATAAALSGLVAPGEHFLIQSGSAGTAPGTPGLPTPDQTVGLNLSASGGVVFLASSTTPVSPRGDVAGVTTGGLVDTVGYGTSANTFETLRTGTALTTTTSASRADTGADNDHNANDFSEMAPTPTACGEACTPPPPTVVEASIAEIQGPGDESPLAGELVRTRGVVTAAYPEGGLWSFVIQTEGTGADDDATPGRSDGLWVFQSRDGVDAGVGDFVELTGIVEERFGRTQLVYDPQTPLTVLTDDHAPVVARSMAYPATAEEREAHESELLDLSGQPFTVSDNFSTNRFGEIGLATGDRPLVTPTEVANPTLDAAGYQAAVDDNFARGVVLDDGSDWDYLNDDEATATPLPWIDRDTHARTGAAATLEAPVLLDYGFGDWRLQPTAQVTGTAPEIITFENTRPGNAGPQPVGGDVTIATFNVLNYFNTTGTDWSATSGRTCSYFRDREGDPVSNNRCEPDGPRGAAETEDLQRQQEKIVTAINTLDASVVSLEEIENSVRLGEERDDALAALTEALNDAAGRERWALVPSPPADELPPLEAQDVIRTAFIYDPSALELVGGSRVLVGSPAFSNARQPLAQAFTPVGATEPADAFAVVANHFKSKGSACEGEPNGPQGNCNESRVRQARALADFADTFAADRDLAQVFLAGDFNAYSEEDPMVVLEQAGYHLLESGTPGEWSYSFAGMAGSLDHVLANNAALAEVAGVDIWEINANEAVAYEYSRFNYNVTPFYAADVFRASDHNPELVGVDVRDASGLALRLTPDRIKQKKETITATIVVTGEDHGATGVVRFLVDGTEVGRESLLDGTASLVLGPFDKGTYTVTVDYLGDDDNLPGSDEATLRVGNGK